MAAPATYTEQTLAEYMHSALGAMAGTVGLTVEGGSYAEAVNDTLLTYGVSDIGDATDIAKLRLLARLHAWRLVVTYTAANYAFSADGGSYSRDQVHAHAVSMVSALETEAAPHLAEYQAVVQRVDYLHDPYVSRDYNEVTL